MSISKNKKTAIIIIVFAGIVYGLKYWLGFESMITTVIIAFGATMIEKDK